jgi:hypothetical protein
MQHCVRKSISTKIHVTFVYMGRERDRRRISGGVRQGFCTARLRNKMPLREGFERARLKVADIMAPMSFHNRVALDFPVSLDGYRNPEDPIWCMCRGHARWSRTHVRSFGPFEPSFSI